MPVFAATRPPQPLEVRLTAIDGGLNLKYDPTQIQDNHAALMQNMVADDLGALQKRNGQAYVYTSSLGAGAVNGAYERLWMGYKVFAWGTAIYRQTGSAAPLSVTTGLANAKGSFFAFGAYLYYINGTDFIRIDASFTAVTVVSVAYVPTITISTPPTGGGETNEQFNLLTPAFKTSFSGNATATAYTLPITGLDATTVTATVDNVAKVEGVDFTVNRTTGVVTFSVAPSNGTNNVIITAYKTVSGYADRIKNCRYLIDYGGDNDTRLFAWGNTSYKNRAFRSGLLDPTYWPENEYTDVGSSAEAITSCAKHYDKLVYLKERSIAFTTYTNPVTQGAWGAAQLGAVFPLSWINGSVGCDMPGSVQVIDNNVVFGNSELGLFVIVNVSLRDEKNVRPLSGNINGATGRPGLLDLASADLLLATSVDDGANYWLCIGEEAYVWNYRLSPFVNTGDAAADEERLSWFYHTAINASAWILEDRTLYYGDRTIGQLVNFTTALNDFSAAIYGLWRSKLFSFNLHDWYKTINYMWFTAKAGGFSTFTIKYISENGETLDQEDVNVSSFRWDQATWANWTWGVNQYPPPVRLKPKQKKVVYFQVEFSNNVANQNLSLLSLTIPYLPVKKVK